jgi:hypothetical protein
VKEHFVHFAGIVKEEFDGQNSSWRIHEVPRAIGSCNGERRIMVTVFLSARSGEIRP